MERSDRARRRVHPADTGPRAGRTVAIASLLLSSSSCTPTIAVSLPEPPATAKSMLIDVEGPGSGSVLALAVDGPFSLAVAMLEPQAIAVAYYGATLVALGLEAGVQPESPPPNSIALPTPLVVYGTNAAGRLEEVPFLPPRLAAIRGASRCHGLVVERSVALPPRPADTVIHSLYPFAGGVVVVGQAAPEGSRTDAVFEDGRVELLVQDMDPVRALPLSDGGLLLVSLRYVYRTRDGALIDRVPTSTVPLRLPTAMAEVGGEIVSIDACNGRIFRLQSDAWVLSSTVPAASSGCASNCDYNDKDDRGGGLIKEGERWLFTYRDDAVFSTRDFRRIERLALDPHGMICHSDLVGLSDGALLAAFDPNFGAIRAFTRAPGAIGWSGAGDLGSLRLRRLLARPARRVWVRSARQGPVFEVLLPSSAPGTTVICPQDPGLAGIFAMVSDVNPERMVIARQLGEDMVVQWVREE